MSAVFPAKIFGHMQRHPLPIQRQIRPGDMVTFVDDELCHQTCANQAGRVTPTCTVCGLQHPGEC